MDLNMRNIVIGAQGTIAMKNESGTKRAFFSFAEGVNPVTRLDEFGTHEDDIFSHADYEKELKQLMNGASDEFLLLDYSLRYLHGAHEPSPYRYVVALMNAETEDWDERFLPDDFDDAESWTEHLISWDVDHEMIKSALKYIRSNKAVRAIDIDLEWMSVYDKTDQSNSLFLSFKLIELSWNDKKDGINIYLKFDNNCVTHAYDITDVMSKALGGLPL